MISLWIEEKLRFFFKLLFNFSKRIFEMCVFTNIKFMASLRNLSSYEAQAFRLKS